MKKYRRIEITAFRRRVTIVSGESLLDGISGVQPAQTGEGVGVYDGDLIESVELESAEGQRIIVEAVRLLEQQLHVQAHSICSSRDIHPARWFRFRRTSFYTTLRSLARLSTYLTTHRYTRKEK